MSKVVWTGSTDCDICGGKCGSVLYDGKTRSGYWAVMCHSCFQYHGVGIGVGKGQKYKRNAEKQYEKVGSKK